MSWNHYQDILAWKAGMKLVNTVYQFTMDFPEEERYGLTAQMRWSAVSVPSNIAEGAARKGENQLLIFLSYALGSLAELETQVEISITLKFSNSSTRLKSEIIECRKITYGLIRSINKE